jgi:hypothetical protein
MVLRLTSGGGQASGAVTISPSLLRTKSRLPKRMVIPRVQTTSWPAIQILKEMSRTCKAPTWRANCRCFELAPTSKLICMHSGSGRCAQWAQNLYWFGQNDPTSSLWRLVLPAPCCSMLVVGVTSERERGEFPSLCSLVLRDYISSVRYLAKRERRGIVLWASPAPGSLPTLPFYRPRRDRLQVASHGRSYCVMLE